MTVMITLDAQITKEEELLFDTRTALQELRDDIEEVREKLAEGQIEEAAKHTSEIKKVVGLFASAIETESRLGTLRERKAGIAQNGHAFDMAAARLEIGRKLDRLRAACSPRPVSGGADG